ncbi:MAG TPA: hypothetical protein VGP55_06565 [Chitinophagaceae bacterium]|nr:hypothetical protein [Chitinophagaceae bacterium]
MNNQASSPYLEPKKENLFDTTDDFLKQFNLTRREKKIIVLLKNNFTN